MQDRAAGERISAAVNHAFNPKVDVVLSRNRLDTGEVLGGAIFTGYTETTITFHCAGFVPNWLNRLFIWAAVDYVFRQLNVLQVIAPIAADNAKSLRAAAHLGFKLISVIPDYYSVGVAQHILRLRRDDCVWLSMPPPLVEVEVRDRCQVLVTRHG